MRPKSDDDKVGSIPAKLDKIDLDISSLSEKIDGLLAGFAEEIEKIEKNMIMEGDENGKDDSKE